MRLVDRYPLRHAVGGACRRKNEMFHTAFAQCVEQMQCLDEIVLKILSRLLDRLTDVRIRREMHRRVNPMFADDLFYKLFVADRTLIKRNAGIDRLAVSVNKIIEDNHSLVARAKIVDEHAADITGAACYE